MGCRYTIGRDSRCDLLIEDTTVSRWHARLERAAGRWLLTDLGSTNGTRLNGWRVGQPVPVQAGDLSHSVPRCSWCAQDERNLLSMRETLPNEIRPGPRPSPAAPGGAGSEPG